jgi:nitrogen fixation NifU-like protein
VSGKNRPGAVEDLARLYLDAIRLHAANPTGFRRPIEATHRHECLNPLCGDRVELMLKVAGATIEQAAFDGEACAICLASASLLCETIEGESVEHFMDRREALVEALKADGPDPEEALKPLLGVRPYPSRVRCATLPWTAASRALAES